MILGSVHQNKAIKIWNTETEQLIAVFEGHEDIATSLAFNINE